MSFLTHGGSLPALPVGKTSSWEWSWGQGEVEQVSCLAEKTGVCMCGYNILVGGGIFGDLNH